MAATGKPARPQIYPALMPEKEGNTMTKKEKIIVSAYTGVLMCDFADMHEYIEQKLGRPVWTHELGDPAVWEQIKAATKEDFLSLCES